MFTPTLEATLGTAVAVWSSLVGCACSAVNAVAVWSFSRDCFRALVAVWSSSVVFGCAVVNVVDVWSFSEDCGWVVVAVWISSDGCGFCFSDDIISGIV